MKKDFSVFIPYSKRFELYNEDEIEEYLAMFYDNKGKNFCDDYELCCLYDDIDHPKYSVYLAFYDNKLYWTLSIHNNKDYSDYENVYTFEWKGERLTKENLYSNAIMVLKELVENYEKVQRGIQKCL